MHTKNIGQLIFGQNLSNIVLGNDGITNVPGTFSITNPTQILNLGLHSIIVTFTPSDTVNYDPSFGNINIIVNKINTTITTIPIASSISHGQQLSSSILSGGVGSVAGSFTFTNPDLIMPAGTQLVSITFTPNDTNYNTNIFDINITIGHTYSMTRLTTLSFQRINLTRGTYHMSL